MNERIKKLAEQAGIELPDSSEYNGHIYRNSIERLARMIVRECADIVAKDMDYDANWCNDKILKHFGIEE